MSARAFRHPAEFDRRAERLPDGAGPAGDEGFGSGVAMRAADGDDPGLAALREAAGVDRLGRAAAPPSLTRQPFGAAADQAAPDQSERRRADDAEQRRAVGDQREIDGELVAAGDEFLGAVERIDQEEAAAIGRLRQMRRAPRTAPGYSGISRARPSPMMRSAARSASVTGDPSALPSIFMARAVDGENGGAGPDHEIGQGLHQRGRGDRGRSLVPDERASFIGGSCSCGSSAIRLQPRARLPLCWQHARPQCIKPCKHA